LHPQSDNLVLLTSESLDLATPHLPAPPARLLEVGCGAGDFALALQQRGYHVTALDQGEQNVARARAKGVNAATASWPHFDDQPFDAILFTRSLHHIRPVRAAVQRAHELLKDGGTLIIEDFAFYETSEATVLWFKNVVDVLDAARVLNHEEHRFASRIAQADGLDAWHHSHAEIASEAEMLDAVQSMFELQTGAAIPHLYRYISQVVKPEVADSVVAAVLKFERAAHAAGQIDLIGRFWAAGK
jgi:SAM-dependent methyltransferase